MSRSCELSDYFLFLYGLPSVCGNTPIHVLTVTPHDALTLSVTVVTSHLHVLWHSIAFRSAFTLICTYNSVLYIRLRIPVLFWFPILTS